MKAKCQCPPEDKSTKIPAWMATFADLMCLLMCFFVLLFAFSKLEEERFKAVSDSMLEAFGGVQMIKSNSTDQTKGMEAGIKTQLGTTKIPITKDQAEQVKKQLETQQADELMKELEQTFHAEIVNQSLVLEREGDDVIIRFPEHVSFSSGSAKLVTKAEPLIQRIVSHLQESQAIVVAGHTDNRRVAGGRFSSNWELSAARAAAVAESLLLTGAVKPDNITVAGYAYTRPIDTNETRDGRAKNRRVEIIVKAGGSVAHDEHSVITVQ